MKSEVEFSFSVKYFIEDRVNLIFFSTEAHIYELPQSRTAA